MLYNSFIVDICIAGHGNSSLHIYVVDMNTILYIYSEECSSKSGTNDGSCASGFGVCCVCKIHVLLHLKVNVFFFYIKCFCITVSLACGGSTSDNNTYLVQSGATTGISQSCKFTICKLSSNICRIRYDFTVRYHN
jgi:hypothetical protein